MRNKASLFAPLKALQTTHIFTHQMTSITFDAIPDVRAAFSNFFHKAKIPADTYDCYLLTISEILTNLVKHPSHAPRVAEILFRADNSGAVLDIADNGPPFSDFDAKCAQARDRAGQDLPLAESGYGLRCILQQHQKVTYTPATHSRDGYNHFSVHDKTEGIAS